MTTVYLILNESQQIVDSDLSAQAILNRYNALRQWRHKIQRLDVGCGPPREIKIEPLLFFVSLHTPDGEKSIFKDEGWNGCKAYMMEHATRFYAGKTARISQVAEKFAMLTMPGIPDHYRIRISDYHYVDWREVDGTNQPRVGDAGTDLRPSKAPVSGDVSQ